MEMIQPLTVKMSCLAIHCQVSKMGNNSEPKKSHEMLTDAWKISSRALSSVKRTFTVRTRKHFCAKAM